ncbi:hypothetical protein PENTCL1PPCAC_1498, partial [Pristionchus entomophagus]
TRMGKAFDDAIHRLFYWLGLKIHRFRIICFIGSIIFTAIASYGLMFLDEQTTIDPELVFSPVNAPWRYERAVLTQHWPLDEQSFYPGKSYEYFGYVDVLVAGKVHDAFGRPNILHAKYLNEIERINNYIVHNLTVPVLVNGKTFEVAYTDLCMTNNWKCFLNDHITMLQPRSKWGNFSAQIAEFAKDIILREVNITYPIGWRGSEPIYFGALVGSPHLIDAEGHFDYASAVRLTFNTRDEKVGNISHLWRKKLTDYLTNKENPPSEFLDIGMYHNESLPEGLQDVADALSPKFAGTVTILFTFCFAASIVLMNHGRGVIGIDWVRSKPIVVVAGILVPLFSIPTAFGLVLWCGEVYNAIVNVSPFLVLCIGIDDLFVMSAAWHRTNPEKRPEVRIAEALEEAAVAITITSVTDILTFGIGIFTPLPAVRIFCVYTSVQCFFTYIYQLTFFSPVLAWAAEMEERGTHSLFFCKAIQASETNSKFKLHLLAGSVSRKSQRRLAEERRARELIEIEAPPPSEATPPSEAPPTVEIPKESTEQSAESPRIVLPEASVQPSPPKKTSSILKGTSSHRVSPDGSSKIKRVVRFLEDKLDHSDNKDLDPDIGEETLVNKVFREILGPFLLERTTQMCAGLIYLIYFLVAIAGVLQIREGLNPKFLVRESFYLADFYALIDETLWQEGLQMQVVVNNPPDLYSKEGREGINQMIAAFEGNYYTMAHNATMLWLTAYDRYLEDQEKDVLIQKPTNSSEWYSRCREWLIVAGGRTLWEKDTVWGDGEGYKQLKAFRFQIGLRNYRTPTDHTESCKMMRGIAASYPQFNVTTFHEYYPFADQYLELKPSLISNIGMGLGMMLTVSLIMIPDWRAACSVVLAIASINLGVLGYMTFWGVNLDSVSMITVIMCIGFAVDLSAHIAYAYALAHGCPKTRAVTALEELGWPVFLGAFSTILGIMVLTLVDSYIVQIFFKTVFLVITFSMLHGLLFLPIFLMVVIPEKKEKEKEKMPGEVAFDLPTEEKIPPVESDEDQSGRSSADSSVHEYEHVEKEEKKEEIKDQKTEITDQKKESEDESVEVEEHQLEIEGQKIKDQADDKIESRADQNSESENEKIKDQPEQKMESSIVTDDKPVIKDQEPAEDVIEVADEEDVKTESTPDRPVSRIEKDDDKKTEK